jgi:hypothetical protein
VGDDEGLGELRDDVREVRNYITALDYGIARLRSGFPLSLRLLRETHERLMTGVRGGRPSGVGPARCHVPGGDPGANAGTRSLTRYRVRVGRPSTPIGPAKASGTDLKRVLGSPPVAPELMRSWEAAQKALAMVVRPEHVVAAELDLGL